MSPLTLAPSPRARWLRAQALSPAIRRLAEEVPQPVLARDHLTPAVADYLSWWIRNADPAGAFSARARWLRRLPATWCVRLLAALGYDGLLYFDDEAVIGHVFFQRRGSDVHGFSTAVGESFGHAGASVVMLLDYVSHASTLPGVARVRVGRGRNPVTRRFLERVGKLERELPWRVEGDGWISFREHDPSAASSEAREAVFRDIFVRNRWGDPESPSGPGSTLTRTSAFRDEIPPLLSAFGVRTVLDAGCGDFNWMKEVRLPVERYVGIDIVPEIVERNRREHASATRAFATLDLVRSPLPRADAIICRDCLVHFTLAEVAAVLENFRRSGARYLLATTFPAVDVNQEIETGSWRPLNMEQAPFRLPPALRHIDERRRLPDGTDARKLLGWWRLNDV